ncbi:MAG: hypothetical protein R2694_08255 [Ilumatobacteraceae bacterium]
MTMPRLDLIRGLRRHPGMFGVAPDDYSALVAYLCGYDAATNGGFLSGFRELIELKLGRTTNVAWWDAVTQLRRPGEDNAHVSDAERIAYLLDVLEEFVIVDSGHLRRLYADWAAMATSRRARSPAICCTSVRVRLQHNSVSTTPLNDWAYRRRGHQSHRREEAARDQCRQRDSGYRGLRQ